MQIFESSIIVEILLLLFILLFAILGYTNKFISEFQKTANLLLSILLSKFIGGYFIDSNSFYIIFILSLVASNILIAFTIDIVVYNLNIVKIDKKADRFIGALLGIFKSFMIIALIIFMFQSILEEFKLDQNINLKARESYIYSFCEQLKDLILFKVKNN